MDKLLHIIAFRSISCYFYHPQLSLEMAQTDIEIAL